MHRAAWLVLLFGCARSDRAPPPAAPAAHSGSSDALEATQEQQAEVLSQMIDPPPGQHDDLGQQTNELSGDSGDISSGTGTGRTGTGRGPGPGTGSSSGSAARPPAATVTVTVADVAFDAATSLAAAAVKQKIETAYGPMLRRCYTTATTATTTTRAAANAKLVFAISATGHVTGPSASGGPGSFGDCAAPVMSGWYFPAPKDRDGEATEVTATVTLTFAVRAP